MFCLMVSDHVFFHDTFMQEVLAGVAVVVSKLEMQHQGITLCLEGAVTLQLSAKSVGLFEAFYNSLKVSCS